MRTVLAASLCVAVLSCSSTPRHANLARFEKDLRLKIHLRTPEATSGSAVSVGFSLTNHGTAPATACRYVESTVHFWGLDERYAKGRLGPVVDHQYCEVRFTIAPGETIEWTEDVRVTDVPPGRAKVMASVRIVDPADCDRYGCYDVNLSATSEQTLAVK